MKFWEYILYRLLLAIVVIFGVVSIVFAISRVVPADPAALWVGAHPTVEAIRKARAELHLDEPLWKQ